MKKRYWAMALGLLLAIVTWAPALATTAIQLEGKEYIFYGDQSVYEADGKTFLIGKDSVTVREEGKVDRVFPLSQASDTSVVVQEAPDTACQAATGLAGSYAEAYAVSDIAADGIAIEGSAVWQTDTEKYSAYAKYGLSYDALENSLYYQGRRVRVFEDSYALDANIAMIRDHFDPAGVIDVEAVRDFSERKLNADGSEDPSGTLTGLHVISGEAFSARDLSQWTKPRAPQATAVEAGTPMTPQEKRAFYAPYAAFGLTYDETTDTLSYQGQPVRRFLDVRNSNGESFSSGRFQGTMTHLYNESGVIDVSTLRDYSRPDAQGDGTLTGLQIDSES